MGGYHFSAYLDEAGMMLIALMAINTCFASAFTSFRVQIAFAISDAKTLRAFSTC